MVIYYQAVTDLLSRYLDRCGRRMPLNERLKITAAIKASEFNAASTTHTLLGMRAVQDQADKELVDIATGRGDSG